MSINKNRPIRVVGAVIGGLAAVAIALPATAGAAPAIEPAQPGATPDHAQLASSTGLALHRDPSKAVPFVADVGPQVPSAGSSFAWGDAAIGAGVMTGAIALGLGGVLGARRLKASPTRSHVPAATSS